MTDQATQVRPQERAGYVEGRRGAAGREWASVYRAGEAGIDAGGRKFAVICEAHGAVAGADKRGEAVRIASDAREFCDGCREAPAEAFERKQGGGNGAKAPAQPGRQKASATGPLTESEMKLFGVLAARATRDQLVRMADVLKAAHEALRAKEAAEARAVVGPGVFCRLRSLRREELNGKRVRVQAVQQKSDRAGVLLVEGVTGKYKAGTLLRVPLVCLETITEAERESAAADYEAVVAGMSDIEKAVNGVG